MPNLRQKRRKPKTTNPISKVTVECADCRFQAHSRRDVATAGRSLFYHQMYHHMRLPADYLLVCDQCNYVRLEMERVSFWLHCFAKHMPVPHTQMVVCDDCGHRQTTLDALRRHIQRKKLTKGPPQVIVCDGCDQQLQRNNLSMLHVQLCGRKDIRVRCHLCPMTLPPSSLAQHIHRMHPRTTAVCDDCERRFSQQRLLEQHVMAVHTGVGFQCHRCPRIFRRNDDCKKHAARHHL